MIGQTVSHYKILEKLGEGGMGVVYKAEDTKLKRVVALKFLPMTSEEDSVEKSRFMREAQAAAALDHPNIATVYEINESEEKPFIVMIFVEGVTLEEKTGSGPLTVNEAIDVAIQITQGLKAAHDRGIIHRDIKSSNIMITPDGQIKITDFGLAKLKGEKSITKTGAQMGTASFMSPEQIQGKNVDQRADIFSFGVVLYELLTGDLPFKGENDQAVMYSILYDEPPSITERQPEVYPELEQIVDKALKKDVKDRYQNSDEILEDLLELKRSLSAGKDGYISKPRIKKKKRSARTKNAILKGPYIYGIVVVLLMLLFYGGLKLFTGHGSTIDSIAVLPFENHSRNPDQEYFVEGMHEALITNLSKIRSLKLISRTSAMHYKESSKEAQQIARELDVDAIVKGSVLNVDDQVRISVQLINGSTNEYIWARSYDRDLQNVLVLISEVAQGIANEIEVELIPQEEERLVNNSLVNTEAYDVYLKGQYFFNRNTGEGYQKSLKYFQEAIDIDPNYAPAWAGLAGAHSLLAYNGAVPPQESIPQGKKAVLKALELDDQHAWAYTVLGWIKLFDWDWSGAKITFQKALQLDPNDSNAYHGYGDYLTVTGNPEKGFVLIKRGRDCDPFSPTVAVTVAIKLYFMHRYDEAIAEANKLLELDPDFPVHRVLAEVFWQKGMYEEALAEYRKVLPPQFMDALNRGYEDSGPNGAIEAVARIMVEQSKLVYIDPLYIAYWYTRTKEIDTTIEWLEKACENRSPALFYIKVRPEFDHLRSDPRFQDILRRMGLFEND